MTAEFDERHSRGNVIATCTGREILYFLDCDVTCKFMFTTPSITYLHLVSASSGGDDVFHTLKWSWVDVRSDKVAVFEVTI